MAVVQFGTEQAKKDAEESSATMLPIGGIFAPGRAIGRVTGKELNKRISDMLVREGQQIKRFAEQLYPTTIRVLVKQPKPGGGFTRFVDEIKGLNSTHAAMRAESNWPGSQISILNEAVKKGGVQNLLQKLGIR